MKYCFVSAKTGEGVSRAINELARQICFKRNRWLEGQDLELRHSQPVDSSIIANVATGNMRNSFLASYKQNMSSSDKKSGYN